MRKRERRFYSFTVSLTIQQIEWLQKQFPSASEYVRHLIDNDIDRREELDIEESEKRLKNLWKRWRELTDIASMRESKEEVAEYTAKGKKVYNEIQRLQEKINKAKRSRSSG